MSLLLYTHTQSDKRRKKQKGFGPAPELYPSDCYRVVYESLSAWAESVTSGNLSSADKERTMGKT